jgi:hypothetical protein
MIARPGLMPRRRIVEPFALDSTIAIDGGQEDHRASFIGSYDRIPMSPSSLPVADRRTVSPTATSVSP